MLRDLWSPEWRHKHRRDSQVPADEGCGRREGVWRPGLPGWRRGHREGRDTEVLRCRQWGGGPKLWGSEGVGTEVGVGFGAGNCGRGGRHEGRRSEVSGA